MLDPDVSLHAAITAILRGLDRWGVAIVFGAMFLDCLPFAAFVAPGVIMLVLAGFVAASKSHPEALLLLFAAAAGVFCSDTLMYAIGRAGYSHSSFVRRVVDKRGKLKRDIGSKSAVFLLFYQFPTYSRMFAPIIMGALDFPLARWLMLVITSTALFVGSFFALGWVAGQTGRDAVGAAKVASVVSTLFVLAFLVWVVGLLVRWFRMRKAKATQR